MESPSNPHADKAPPPLKCDEEMAWEVRARGFALGVGSVDEMPRPAAPIPGPAMRRVGVRVQGKS